jgi:hypothetical protein
MTNIRVHSNRAYQEGKSENSRYFMEPVGSLLCSQEPLLNQMDPTHIAPSSFSKIHFNTRIKYPPTHVLVFQAIYSLHVSRKFRTGIYVTSPTRATCPSHLTLLDLMTIIKFGEGCKL